jgi:2-amino-4-hydroxy-6-hydroxymethyldihydropteridine diphosphokinase
MLLYRNSVIRTPQLTVPHPRMLERRFVLEPLLELAPGLKDPRTRKPIAEALARVQDQQVKKL